ncbi:MAG: efflux RND transporter permease subunit, partial [Armatimonadetes bacterium]|nr:efflux RND transporter permease subunit [Armatimonadota bacterium]
SVAVFASIFPLWSTARKNYTPLDDEAQFTITARAPEGTSLEGTRRIFDDLAADLRALPEVRVVVVTVGSDRGQTPNLGTTCVRLNEVEDRQQRFTQFQIMETARTRILPKYRAKLLWLSLLKAGGLTGSPQADVQLSVSGPDLAVLAHSSDAAVAAASRLPGVSDVQSSLVTGQPELRATIDRVRAADLGVNVADVAQALRLGVAGDDKISSYVEGGEEYEVHTRLAPQYRRDVSGLDLLLVSTTDATGGRGTVTLDQVTQFVNGISPAAIERYNRNRQYTLKINLVPGFSQGAATDAALRIMKDQKLGPAYRVVATGPQREFKRTFTAFLMAFLMSFLIMYLVVAAQFESFNHALVIMITLPLTMPFAMLSLRLSGESLNIFSMLGMLVLLGVVKKNAILQVDRANQLREAGMSLHDATVQACKDRLRPILMTTLAFVAGMVPLVLARGTGAGTSRATGGVIVGGQMLSLLLTLVAAPVFYVVLDDCHGGRSSSSTYPAWRRPSPQPSPGGRGGRTRRPKGQHRTTPLMYPSAAFIATV